MFVAAMNETVMSLDRRDLFERFVNRPKARTFMLFGQTMINTSRIRRRSSFKAEAGGSAKAPGSRFILFCWRPIQGDSYSHVTRSRSQVEHATCPSWASFASAQRPDLHGHSDLLIPFPQCAP